MTIVGRFEAILAVGLELSRFGRRIWFGDCVWIASRALDRCSVSRI